MREPFGDLGLEAGIHQFNAESEPELVALNDVAASLGKRAPITIRIDKVH